jgi:hypothetical protein
VNPEDLARYLRDRNPALQKAPGRAARREER